MKDVKIEEVVEAFGAAKNVNAALKHLIKNETAQNAPLMHFAKDFRSAVSGFNSGAAQKSFIERNYKTNELFFLIAARYAHAVFIDPFLDGIIGEYGDAFNATYQSTDNGIQITDQAKFAAIGKEVFQKTRQALQQNSLPASQFMELTIYHSLFEPNVLKEILKIS